MRFLMASGSRVPEEPDTAGSDPEPWVLAPHGEAASPHVEALPDGDLLRVGDAAQPLAEPPWPEQDAQDEQDEAGHEQHAPPPHGAEHHDQPGAEAEPRAAHVRGGEARQHHEPWPGQPPGPRSAREQARESGQQDGREDAPDVM